MTTRAPNWFERKYVDGAIHVLQTEGYLLRGACMDPIDVKGNEVVWKIAGSGEATEMAAGIENRPTINANRTTVTGTIKSYEANEDIQTQDLTQMSENEQQIAQQTCGYAMGRKFDKIIMSAMDAETTNIDTIGDGTAAISVTDIFAAQSSILSQGVIGTPEMYCALPYIMMTQLELYKEFSNSDYQGPEFPMRKVVGARTYKGVHFIPLANTGTLNFFNVPNTGQADAYIWLKNCTGFAAAEKMDSRIDYVPEKKVYRANNTMQALSKVILPTGIRRLRFATPATLTRPT